MQTRTALLHSNLDFGDTPLCREDLDGWQYSSRQICFGQRGKGLLNLAIRHDLYLPK